MLKVSYSLFFEKLIKIENDLRDNKIYPPSADESYRSVGATEEKNGGLSSQVMAANYC
jgi:hypothetical protein